MEHDSSRSGYHQPQPASAGHNFRRFLEEADELCNEAETKQDVVWEAADLFYFMNVLMYREGVTWRDVYAELDRRHKST